MNCKHCGIHLQSNQELCDKCVKQYSKEMDIICQRLTSSTPYEQREEEKQKKKSNYSKWILLLGFVCPLIWIGYIIYKFSPVIAKHNNVFENKQVENNTHNNSTSSNSTNQSSSFTFFDGAGNYCQSGGAFIDWAGNLCEWGTCFTDARGNLIEWGQPFYDYRDNYCAWGSPFYDSRGNYIVP